MAQNVEIHLEDELDGGYAEDTVQLSQDGMDYEIDLAATNADKLREGLRPHAAAGRKATRSSGPRGARSLPSSSDPDRTP